MIRFLFLLYDMLKTLAREYPSWVTSKATGLKSALFLDELELLYEVEYWGVIIGRGAHLCLRKRHFLNTESGSFVHLSMLHWGEEKGDMGL